MVGENRESHPVADLFPLMRGQAFQELVADIRQNGLREPILCDAKGRILDGRNRYRVCLEAGVEPRFVTWEGKGSPAELSLSLNLHRRHLGESQRAVVAARLAKLLQATRPARGANLHHAKLLRSHDQAAAAVNVSRRLLMHASKVLNDGGAKLLAAVESGTVTVSTASLLAGLPKEEQERVVAGGDRAIAAKARELRAPSSRSEPAMRSADQPPGLFGVVSTRPGTSDSVVFLWVAPGSLADAIEALKARGFRYAPGECCERDSPSGSARVPAER